MPGGFIPLRSLNRFCKMGWKLSSSKCLIFLVRFVNASVTCELGECEKLLRRLSPNQDLSVPAAEESGE